MAKIKQLYLCNNCDAQFSKWSGRCLECGKWGSIDEEPIQEPAVQQPKTIDYQIANTVTLKDVQTKQSPRISLSLLELNRVLGGGIVPGSFLLLGGEPGIGKSTLSLQLASLVEGTIYFSGEESTAQVGMRAKRLFGQEKHTYSMKLSNETNANVIAATIHKQKPKLAIVDSIQTIFAEDVAGEPGNVSQVRACATKLLAAAKLSGTTIVLIGHVTKDGSVAGPRTLEHLVDTVLYIEGDRYHTLRLLRSVKNRFGSTDEIGMFEMLESGLQEVSNPSKLLLKERGESMPGSVVTCLMEGTRPILVEIQALVNPTSFGFPVRKASGFDLNRLHVLIAVLQKRARINLSQHDVHVNIVGGIQAKEPAADLAVCLAIASAFKDKALGNDLAVFGEVGLGGEIRTVRFTERRIKECSMLGMKRVITKEYTPKQGSIKSGLNTIPVKNIAELVIHTK